MVYTSQGLFGCKAIIPKHINFILYISFVRLRPILWSIINNPQHIPMDRNVESHHKITIFKKALPVKEHVYKLSNSAALRESRIDCKRIQGEIGKKNKVKY